MNQNQARLLVGAILILVIVGGALYFQKSILNLFVKDTAQNSPQNNNGQLIKQPGGRQIKGVSFIDGYTLELFNATAIIAELERLNIFGKKFINVNNYSTGDKELNEIHLILKDKSPPSSPIYGENTYAFTGKGILQINIVVSKSDLEKSNIREEILRNFISGTFKAVYNTTTEEDIESEVDKIMEELQSRPGDYIVITKN